MDFPAEVSLLPVQKRQWLISYSSGPAGAVALILVIISMPAKFPHQKSLNPLYKRNTLTLQNVRRIDFLGLVLLLGASILLITALEEGGTQYSWHSPVTLTLLAVSFVLWFLFVGWQWYQSKRQTMQEPIFPWHLAKDRFVMGILLQATIYSPYCI